MKTLSSFQRLVLRAGVWTGVMLLSTFAVSFVTRYAFVVPLLWMPVLVFAINRHPESETKL